MGGAAAATAADGLMLDSKPKVSPDKREPLFLF